VFESHQQPALPSRKRWEGNRLGCIGLQTLRVSALGVYPGW